MCRYIIYFCYYCLLSLCMFSDLSLSDSLINFTAKDQEREDLSDGINDTLFVIIGPLIIYLRLSEPYVLQELRYQFKRCFCRRSKRSNKIKYSAESLDSFLNS